MNHILQQTNSQSSVNKPLIDETNLQSNKACHVINNLNNKALNSLSEQHSSQACASKEGSRLDPSIIKHINPKLSDAINGIGQKIDKVVKKVASYITSDRLAQAAIAGFIGTGIAIASTGKAADIGDALLVASYGTSLVCTVWGTLSILRNEVSKGAKYLLAGATFGLAGEFSYLAKINNSANLALKDSKICLNPLKNKIFEFRSHTPTQKIVIDAGNAIVKNSNLVKAHVHSNGLQPNSSSAKIAHEDGLTASQEDLSPIQETEKGLNDAPLEHLREILKKEGDTSLTAKIFNIIQSVQAMSPDNYLPIDQLGNPQKKSIMWGIGSNDQPFISYKYTWNHEWDENSAGTIILYKHPSGSWQQTTLGPRPLDCSLFLLSPKTDKRLFLENLETILKGKDFVTKPFGSTCILRLAK